MARRKQLKQLTTGLLGRTVASGRVAAHLGKAAARTATRLATAATDADLGQALAAELDGMKGLAMKVGQMASYLHGTLPPEAQAVLVRLQQGAEPVPFETLRPGVEAALGGSIGTLFDRFDPQPIAAASIAQVHRAALDGREVAVKVQYPGIRDTLDVDLGHLRRITRLVGLGAAFDARELVGELRDRLLEECDFAAEAAHQTRFRAAWSDVDWVQIPAVIAERSVPTVLTTDFADGRRFAGFVADSDPSARDLAGERLFRFAFGSVFGHAMLHGDPHPGNYLFGESGDHIAFLDFGCVRRYDAAFVDTWKRLAWTVLEDRREDLRDVMVDTGMVDNPDRYDFDYHWRVMQYLYEPFTAPRFRYTTDYVARSYAVLAGNNPNRRRTRMPAEWVLTNRLQWGLNNVLAHLQAEGDFGAVMRECLAMPTPGASSNE